ncbi:DNA repair exonuclease [Acuticoccus sp. MNP-M23]|uniref:metallophosphoesterase family protein n=1 Tax=Acuticoccus sp. MNP-M23 TaxID=3072793 RepID=UPI00281503AC|nr:DNA repair exonuclease [Acuticoccus sp. MNP-M23]WMS42438.1 DNA repair exonuclease [Acuticoccus sp. MNP-M23]
MAFSFIHTGDLHLDSPLTRLVSMEDERAVEIARAGRRAFAELVDMAIERGVNAFLIAGDLWDGDWQDVGTGLFVQRQVARLADAGIGVFAILGNHDAASHITDRIRHFDKLTLFGTDRPSSVECGEAVIHGMSFARRETVDNLAVRYPPAWPGRINIGLLHTGLENPRGHARYAPCSLAELSAKGYHYWALGHIHARETLQENTATLGGTIAYCGVLQGRHVREPGVKGALHGTVEGERVHLAEIDLAHVEWFEETVDVTSEPVESAIRAALERVATGATAEIVPVRLVLTGASEHHFALLARQRALLDDARLAASGLANGRLLVERVRIATTPPAAEGTPHLPSHFDDFLARAAADPAVAKGAQDDILAILENAGSGEARAALLELLPEIAAFENFRDLSALTEAAAATVAGRLAGPDRS